LGIEVEMQTYSIEILEKIKRAVYTPILWLSYAEWIKNTQAVTPKKKVSHKQAWIRRMS
jgi:hypothetical protein